jgi:hypothetical protein
LGSKVKVVDVKRLDDLLGEVIIEQLGVEYTQVRYKDGQPQWAIDLLDFVQSVKKSD